ncbi:MAG: hypothetical protein SO089_02660, partial [Dialister sp.]|nr:hypothetical protein [Dialister sp.]
FCIGFMVQVGGFRVVVRIAILSYRHFERSREIFLADREATLRVDFLYRAMPESGIQVMGHQS